MKIFKKIFVFIYIIIAVELFFRIFYPRAMLPRYITTTEFGIRGNMKNASYVHKAPEYKVKIKINSKGVRADHEIQYKKANKHVKRVVLLGDSFGLGYGVNLEESFPEQMRLFLKQHKIDIEVINLSVSGHGNAEELIMLENEGFKYVPDLVILQFHRTDYKDNTRSGLFVLKDSILVKKNEEYLPAVKVREKLFSYAFYRWIAGNYQTYTWIREEASQKVKQVIAQKDNEIVTSNAQNTAQNIKPDRLTIALIQRMNTECRAKGIEFMVLDVPKKLDRGVYKSSYLTNFKKDLPGVHYISPVTELTNGYKGKKLYWEKAHGHFTPLGTRIVGKALSDYIIEHNLLKSSD